MKLLRWLVTITITTLLFLSPTSPVLAAHDAGGDGGGGTESGPTTDLESSVTALNFFQKDIGSFITPLVETALIVGSILTLMYLLWGGIDWIMSGGDKAKYEGARSRITAAILGLAIMASAWTLWLLINYFLGLDKIIKTDSSQSTPQTAPNESQFPTSPFEDNPSSIE